jgi:hypothetical protein
MPDTNPTQADIINAKRKTLAAYKGHLTRALDTFTKQAALVCSVPPTQEEVETLAKISTKALLQDWQRLKLWLTS